MKTQEAIVKAIKEEPVIARHIDPNHWVSGTQTTVYPISLWRYNVNVQMDTRHNRFSKAIARVLAKHGDLFKDGYFCKNDKSCPAEIRFVYTDETRDRLNLEVSMQNR